MEKNKGIWDTLINFWNMGIQSFLIFGDNCQIFFKDMGYFLKKLMGYGILGPIFGDNCQFFLKDMGYFLKKLMGYGILGPPLPGPHFYSEGLRKYLA